MRAFFIIECNPKRRLKIVACRSEDPNTKIRDLRPLARRRASPSFSRGSPLRRGLHIKRLWRSAICMKHVEVAMSLASCYTNADHDFSSWSIITMYVHRESSKDRSWDELQNDSLWCSLVTIKVRKTCNQSLFSFHLNIPHYEVQ